MEFIARATSDGGLNFGERNRAIFLRYLKENPGVVLRITPVLPESRKQRAFLEGAIIPLVAYYQEGMDHRSADDCRKVREWLKLEFNAEIVIVNGRPQRVAKSTKGREALQPFLENVVDWLIENYAPPAEALDPEAFKRWRDMVFSFGGPDTYIGWLQDSNVLLRKNGETR